MKLALICAYCMRKRFTTQSNYLDVKKGQSVHFPKVKCITCKKTHYDVLGVYEKELMPE